MKRVKTEVAVAIEAMETKAGLFVPQAVLDQLPSEFSAALEAMVVKQLGVSAVNMEEAEPYPVRSKEEMLASLERSIEEVNAAKRGEIQLLSAEEVLKELED
jgi:hypothetical protein